MRATLQSLVRNSVLYKYSLPNGSVHKSVLSAIKDDCYENSSSNDLSKIIYNSIIEYSFDEFELNGNWDALHARALTTRLRFDEDSPFSEQLKYGFFGEVLLYAMLHVIYSVPVLISRGHFYLPGENSETKGYDSYHLLQIGQSLQLWFGEVKFHASYTQAINSALSNIENVLSDAYLRKRNLVAIFDKLSSNNNYGETSINQVIEKWKDNPHIDLMQELIDNNISLVYPIFIIANQNTNDSYDETITKWVTHINSNFNGLSFNNISIPFTITFIFLPVNTARDIKSQVLSWISSNQPLI